MNRVFLFLLLSITLYGLIFTVLSLGRHRSLNSTYLDLGLESQTLWNTSQGRPFENSFGENGQLISSLSYHLTPISLPIAFFYRLWPSPEGLLFIQTLALALGALVVFSLAKKILNNEGLALIFSLIYLLYPPLQYTNLSDFHFVSLATPLLLSVLYFLTVRRWRFFYLCLFLAVLTKENVALVAALLGLFLAVFLGEKKRGIIIFLLSAFYFLFSAFFLMPTLGGGFGALGRYQTLITDPLRATTQLFIEPKIKYLFHLLVSVGFLPFLSPAALLPAFSEFFLNLFSDYNPQWQVKFHYTAVMTPFIFVSAIYGAQRLLSFLERRRVKNPLLLVALLLTVPAVVWSFLHSPAPWNLKFDPSKYLPTRETQEALKIISQIPPEASVSAMNNLGPHLSNRRFLYRFPILYQEAGYVVVDPSVVGQNFDLAQVSAKDYTYYLDRLRQSSRYERIVDKSWLLVFKKKL